jgi:hypothetical protein
MKPVLQLERTGCGIASVAALAGVPYRQAQRTANRLGIFCRRQTVVVRDATGSSIAETLSLPYQEGDSLRIVVGIARSGTIGDQVAS